MDKGSDKKYQKYCMQIVKYMNYFKLLTKPFEIILIAFVSFLAAIILAVYLLLCIIVEIGRKGYRYGFRRNIT